MAGPGRARGRPARPARLSPAAAEARADGSPTHVRGRSARLRQLCEALLLLAVIISLVNGDEKCGGQLLLKAITVWGTNVIVFGLWFWEVDRGGPVRRLRPKPPPADWQFPQMENPDLAAPGWRPELIDYLYVSATNSIAFSPTDAMPLSRRAKLLMLAESMTAGLTVLLVLARAVNIVK